MPKLSDTEAEFLNKIIDINMSLNDLVDERANFLAGIAGIISVVALTQIFSVTGLVRIGFLVIVITSLASIILSIGVIRPKQLTLKRINLMYYGGILAHKREEYYKLLEETLKSRKRMIKEYVKEYYDLSKELKARFRLIRRIGDILIIGLISGFILILMSLVIPY